MRRDSRDARDAGAAGPPPPCEPRPSASRPARARPPRDLRSLCQRPPALWPRSPVAGPRPPPGPARPGPASLSMVLKARSRSSGRGGARVSPGGTHGTPRVVSRLRGGGVSLRALPDGSAPGRRALRGAALSVCLSPSARSSSCPCSPASPPRKPEGLIFLSPPPAERGWGILSLLSLRSPAVVTERCHMAGGSAAARQAGSRLYFSFKTNPSSAQPLESLPLNTLTSSSPASAALQPFPDPRL